MSIAINVKIDGMKMPGRCYLCPFVNVVDEYEWYTCLFDRKKDSDLQDLDFVLNNRFLFCPLKEVSD